MDKKQMGIFGEQKACEMLMMDGYRILERNYRCRIGEIDIVAVDRHGADGRSEQSRPGEGPTIVFVEVKTRASDRFGRPAEAVTAKKQEKIKKVALWYMKDKGLEGYDMRFDVIEVFVNHIRGAF